MSLLLRQLLPLLLPRAPLFQLLLVLLVLRQLLLLLQRLLVLCLPQLLLLWLHHQRQVLLPRSGCNLPWRREAIALQGSAQEQLTAITGARINEALP